MVVTVRYLGKAYEFDECTVASLKHQLSAQALVSECEIRLISKGRWLEDRAECIPAGSKLMMM